MEAKGIPTVSLSINRGISEKVRAPRSLFVRFPHGAPFGEPGNVGRQRAILYDLFRLLYEVTEPGAIVDAPYLWRRGAEAPIPDAAFAALGPGQGYGRG